MADVKLVCDASFDDRLKLAGFAGTLHVEDENDITATFVYKGVSGEVSNIQEGEFKAILVGVRELVRQAELAKDAFSIERLSIYSDSRNTIELLKGLQSGVAPANKKLNVLFNSFRSICLEEGLTPEFNHVNSHVDKHNASGIERLNILADESASKIRKEAFRRMLKPSTDDSNTVAVILPGRNYNTKEKICLHQLGYEMAKKRRHFRIYVEDPSANEPFINGVRKWCSKNRLSPQSVLKIYSYNAQATHYGLDMVLYRYHALKQGRNSRFELFHDPIEARAAIASRMLYGEVEPTLGAFHAGVMGRLYPPSSAVMDLSDPLDETANARPNTVQGWLHTYLDYVELPLLKGVRQAFRYEGITTPDLLDIKERRKKAAPFRGQTVEAVSAAAVKKEHKELKELHKNYSTSLNPEEFTSKVVEFLYEQGYPKTELFAQAIQRFARSNISRSDDVFAARIIKQAQKLTTPQDRSPNT